MEKIVLSSKSKSDNLRFRLAGLAFFILINILPLRAQVNVVYNQFFMNPYLYNPAYAGVEGHTVIFALYRQQWMNFQNSPAISNVSFHTPLKGGIGIGATVFNETQGPLTTSWGKISSSYLITVDKEHYLRFGLSLGAGNNTLNFAELDAPTDPAFTNLVDNSTFLIGDFGATYHFGHFNAGFSIPNLVTYDVISPETNSPIRVSPLDNVLFKANYRGHLNDDLAIEPHLIYRYSSEGPDQYEGTVIFHIKHVTWAGASFRQDNNLVGLIGIKLKESFAIGYSFELGNSSIASTLGPTHELHVGYHLGSKKEHAEHVSSFIKSHRLSAEERAKKAELERERKLAALRKSRAGQQPARTAQGEQEDEDSLGGLLGTSTEENNTDPDPAPTETDPAPEVPSEQRTNQFGEREKQVTFERTGADGEPQSVNAWVPADTPDEKWKLDPEAEHRERTAPDGTVEVAIELLRTDAEGNTDKVVRWQPVEEATPVQETPVEDTPVVEAPTETPVDPTPQEVVKEDIPEETPVEVENTPVVVVVPQENTPPQDSTLTEDFRTPEELAQSTEPETVKRGSHILELPAGSYVIAGAFESFDGAEDVSDQLFERGFHEAKVGYVSARSYYYVVIFESDQESSARSERNRIRNLPDLDQVWVLTVSE
ncbi:MAG: PorP/SprF family type IX secretion system membrane protein [Cytophagales bacterium]|nr:PorP/SprF family type IX secretion system membrane protein [Cytophagales bacterium]